MKMTATTKTRGRPRAFNVDKALEQALRVFWKNGYEGASLPTLTKAMGINRPSLYATFGNKESLFRKAVDRYMEKSGGLMCDALSQPTARATVERLFKSAIGTPTPGKVRGCLLVQGALACSDSADPIRKELACRRSEMEGLLRQRFERAVAEGDLGPDADPAGLAKYVATFQQGLAVQMAGGTDRDELLKAVGIALRAWPAAST
jgi:AcrR family transcriptional regulator